MPAATLLGVAAALVAATLLALASVVVAESKESAASGLPKNPCARAQCAIVIF